MCKALQFILHIIFINLVCTCGIFHTLCKIAEKWGCITIWLIPKPDAVWSVCPCSLSMVDRYIFATKPQQSQTWRTLDPTISLISQILCQVQRKGSCPIATLMKGYEETCGNKSENHLFLIAKIIPRFHDGNF